MRILTTAAQFNDELLRLIEACSSCQVAVAWASVGFDAFELLTTHSSKIKRMVVGTHFYQTHPKFIEAFLARKCARFVLNPDGVFHPKVYLFEMQGGTWECIVGSPNFTHNGVALNDEVAVLLSSTDSGSQEALQSVSTAIDGYWQLASRITQSELQAYRDAWKRKQLTLKHLQGKFGKPEEESDDKGKNPLAVPILAMTWPEYFSRVKSEQATPLGHSMEGRLQVIKSVQRLFAEHKHFKDIERLGRQRIAGLVMPGPGDSVDFGWFGSMKGAGKFWKAINSNDEQLSLALDLIPIEGGVSREVYLEYIEGFKLAFPEGRHGIGTATRLLAMKRPDTFVCLDAQNSKGLCKAFGIRRYVGYEEYWDSIVARIMEAANWWGSPRPKLGAEREVWDSRAAFLDSLFYDGTHAES